MKIFTDFDKLEIAVETAEDSNSDEMFAYNFQDGTYSIWQNGIEQDIGLSLEMVEGY